MSAVATAQNTAGPTIERLGAGAGVPYSQCSRYGAPRPTFADNHSPSGITTAPTTAARSRINGSQNAGSGRG
ncbi:MAG: hypothetical protein DMF85_20255 [Acidobacteria bacterium]|nr:MAG: hypothetical protein DMF85_20255 [Acidobacteriota bacterium]